MLKSPDIRSNHGDAIMETTFAAIMETDTRRRRISFGYRDIFWLTEKRSKNPKLQLKFTGAKRGTKRGLIKH
jgi:hypothetical protein